MKKLLYLPLILLGLPCLFFVFILIKTFELNYIQAKLENNLPGYDEIAILALIIPAYYFFSLMAFLVLGFSFNSISKPLNLEYYKDEIWDIMIYWCPFVLVLGVVLFRFINNPSLNFMNIVDWIGFAFVVGFHTIVVISVYNK